MNTSLDILESLLRGLGGVFAYATLAFILYGIWRGTQRTAGRSSGKPGMWLRSSWFYVLTTLVFVGLSAWGWKPIPLSLSNSARAWMLMLGSLLYFPGLGLVLWGRLALAKNYFVSTGMGAQLFQGHQLVQHGPFAYVRHPMYLGLILAAPGALLLYFTWTSLYFAVIAPMLLVRARREEKLLAQEFGESWHEYCNRVPMLFPFRPELRRK